MQSLKDIEKTIEAEIALRVKAATALSDSYWEWFRKSCKDAWAAKNRGEDVNLGKVAPAIMKKKSGQGYVHYLRWRLWGGDFARRSNKSIGRDIGTANQSDYKSELIKACSWELTKALELEEKLIPIRAEICAMREAIVRLRAGQRKLSKLTTKE